MDDAEWCNGSTADSDSVSRGSNPFSVVRRKSSIRTLFFFIISIGVWLSLVECYIRDVEVARSNRVTPRMQGILVCKNPLFLL